MKDKILTVYVLILYPIYTLVFASQASFLYENLSYVGNELGHRFEFLLWGIATSLALGIGIWRCIPFCVHRKVMRLMVYATTILLMASIAIPYLPKLYPLLAFSHVMLAFIAPGSLLLCVVFVLFELFLGQYSFFTRAFNCFLFICMLSLGILFRFGSVNSLVEIFISISCTYLLCWIASQCKKYHN